MNFRYSLSRLKQRLFLKNFDVMYRYGNISPPNSVVWDSTRRCNLECVHCGSHGNYERELDTSEIKDVIDQLSLLGVKNFQVTGGEPLLRKDLIDVLIYADGRGLKTSFASNGYYIDENKAMSISKANVYSIQISIDGTKEIHNQIRKNAESFDNAIGAIRSLRKNSGSKVGVATTVMPQNIDSLARLKEMLLSLDIDFWNLGTVMPVGKAENNPSLYLSKEQFNSLMDFAVNSREDIKIDIGENFPYLGRFDEMVRRNPKICPVGILSCCIGADGHIRGCPDQPDSDFYREGCIRDEKFKDIWERGFRRYRNRDVVREDKRCSSCGYKADCFGGCWVMRKGNLHCIRDYVG
jgi:radical SAM protein with 4Fe4S-binding SPASM domain